MNDQQPQNQLTPRVQRIEDRIDRTITETMSLAQGGDLHFANLDEIMEVAKVMAIASIAIPKHLRENVGACLAVCIQSSAWQMSPFAVANKSYVVNDRLSFESQLVTAVIKRRAPITEDGIECSYSGTGQTRRCKVWVTLKSNGKIKDYESPEIAKIPVQNSPLWKGDPDQQLFYYSARALARRHFPDVLLGVYTPEEMAEAFDVRDVGPAKPDIGTEAPVAALPAAATTPQPTPAPAKPDVSPAPAVVEAVGTATPVDGGAESTPLIDDPKAKEILLEEINTLADDINLSTTVVRAWAAKHGFAPSARPLLSSYPLAALQQIKARWNEIVQPAE